MDNLLQVSLLDYTGRSPELTSGLRERLDRLTGAGNWQLTDVNPDVLFFLSGGSERYAMERVRPGGRYLLVGSRHGNSFASAAEVKAWMNSSGIGSMLLDEEDGVTPQVIDRFRTARQAIERLKGKRIGVVGRVSGWLIASDVEAEVLRERLGIERIDIDWSRLPSYRDFGPSEPFLQYYSDRGASGLEDTARVSELLSDTVSRWKLDAITVECFPLVKENGVTACLPLARFNDLGFPAGCEGDLTAIAGMMLVRELTGTVPWIANLNRVSEEGCLFSHCTVAPGMVDGMQVTTHYETGQGTAIRGRFRSESVTVFRFDRTLTRTFIATGTVTERPGLETACRTQIKVRLQPDAVKQLREDPLGNHHLVLPGDWAELVRMAVWMAGAERTVDSLI